MRPVQNEALVIISSKKCQNFEFSKFSLFLLAIDQNYHFSGVERHKMIQIEVGIIENNTKNKNFDFLHHAKSNEKIIKFGF